MTGAETLPVLYGFIGDPNIAFLLVTLGLYGVIYEVASPGTFLPSILGVTCLILGAMGMNVLPVNFAGLGLVLIGIIMMSAEAFVFSKGMLAFGGGLSFIIGSVILYDTEDPHLKLSWVTIFSVTLFVAGGLSAILYYIVQSYRRDSAVKFSLVGQNAMVIDWSGATGRVEVEGSLWQAQSQSGHTYMHGDMVRIIHQDNLTLIIE